MENNLDSTFFLPEKSFGGRKVKVVEMSWWGNIFGGKNLLPGSALTLKRVGAHCAPPPSMFTRFFGLNAIVMDAHSIFKFLNICCGRFEVNPIFYYVEPTPKN